MRALPLCGVDVRGQRGGVSLSCSLFRLFLLSLPEDAVQHASCTLSFPLSLVLSILGVFLPVVPSCSFRLLCVLCVMALATLLYATNSPSAQLTDCPAQLSPPSSLFQMAPKAVCRAEREDEARRLRACLNEHEGQIEDLQGTARHHDLRLQYLEAPYKWVTRGLTSKHSFLQKKDENFRATKVALF